MKFLWPKKNAKTAFSLAGLVFLWAGIFGVLYSTEGMATEHNGTMIGCALAKEMSVCPMGVSDHLARWKEMTSADMQRVGFVFSFLIAAAVSFLLLGQRGRLLLAQIFHLADSWRLYLKRTAHIPLFCHWQREFASGLINPKIY